MTLANDKPLMEGEWFSYPLASLTSWHIGGKAERFYYPQSQENLANYLKLLPQDLSVTWLGLGSNVLIRDGGVKGAVICTRGLNEMTQREDGSFMAQAGVSCAKFARFAAKMGYPKAGFFAGIPGTIGGALAMNAGAFGGETWEWVEQVQVINPLGECILRDAYEFEVDYRFVKAREASHVKDAFIAGIFRFPREEDVDGMRQIRELLRKRSSTQPIGTFNCGSVYRNPNGDFAARLIESCDLKGYRVGDAMISPKHANFIINLANARAKDVEALMETIETQVLDRFGIQLHPEVKILGIND